MLIIYGGSFNPVTKAHEEIINILKTKFSEAKILLMPVNKDNYSWKHNLATNQDRYNMLSLVFGENMISDYEFLNKNYGGTYNLIKEFEKIDNDVYFVIGTDNLLQMDKWLNYEKLLNEGKFILFERHGEIIDEAILKKYKNEIKIIKFDSPISSTKIRENLELYKNDLNVKVYNYIKEHKLYEV